MKEYGMRNDIETLLQAAGTVWRTPEHLDARILATAARIPQQPRQHLRIVSAGGMAGLLLLALGFVILLQRWNTEYECRRTLATMVQAVEKGDIETALSLCATESDTASRLEQSLRRFYARYPSVRYQLRNVRIKTQGRSALATTEYVLVASGEQGELRLQGSDRLYMERGPDGRFRIHHWIDG